MKVEYINHSRILFVAFYSFISRRFINPNFNRASGPPPQDRPFIPAPQVHPLHARPLGPSSSVMPAPQVHPLRSILFMPAPQVHLLHARPSGPSPQVHPLHARPSGSSPPSAPSGPPPQVGSKKVVEADEIHISKNFESCLLEFNN